MEKAPFQIPPVYHRSFRCAFWLQFVGIFLSSLILDIGEFGLRYLCITLVFWIVVGVLAFRRTRPTIAERIVIAIGPQLIFWIIFLSPW